jgi:hypothetical protein
MLHRIILPATIVMPVLAGCAASRPTPADYGSRFVASKDRAAVLDAAEAALIDAGFKIDRRDAAAGTILSQPIEGAPVDDRSSYRRRTRRVAEVRLDERGGAFKVYCKVQVQDLVTQGYGMFSQDKAASDSPGEYSAINRDAATTTEQNTVWRTTRRDKPTERRILDYIAAHTGGEGQP